MKKMNNFTITTPEGLYICTKDEAKFGASTDKSKDSWQIQVSMKRAGGVVDGVLNFPGDCGPTRIMQFLEGLDNAS